MNNDTILGPGKGIWASQSDHSSVKVMCLHFWPDQSECRFILLPLPIKYTTLPIKPRKMPIFTRPFSLAESGVWARDYPVTSSAHKVRCTCMYAPGWLPQYEQCVVRVKVLYIGAFILVSNVLAFSI